MSDNLDEAAEEMIAATQPRNANELTVAVFEEGAEDIVITTGTISKSQADIENSISQGCIVVAGPQFGVKAIVEQLNGEREELPESEAVAKLQGTISQLENDIVTRDTEIAGLIKDAKADPVSLEADVTRIAELEALVAEQTEKLADHEASIKELTGETEPAENASDDKATGE